MRFMRMKYTFQSYKDLSSFHDRLYKFVWWSNFYLIVSSKKTSLKRRGYEFIRGIQKNKVKPRNSP